MTTRTIVVVTAGLSQPSSTRLLADRLAGRHAPRARRRRLRGPQRGHRAPRARDRPDEPPADGLPQPATAGRARHRPRGRRADRRHARVQRVVQRAVQAVLRRGRARFAGRHAGPRRGDRRDARVTRSSWTTRCGRCSRTSARPPCRPAVFAAAEDWGQGATPADTALAERIDRAAGELARAAAQREPRQQRFRRSVRGARPVRAAPGGAAPRLVDPGRLGGVTIAAPAGLAGTSLRIRLPCA